MEENDEYEMELGQNREKDKITHADAKSYKCDICSKAKFDKKTTEFYKIILENNTKESKIFKNSRKL